MQAQYRRGVRKGQEDLDAALAASFDLSPMYRIPDFQKSLSSSLGRATRIAFRMAARSIAS